MKVDGQTIASGAELRILTLLNESRDAASLPRVFAGIGAAYAICSTEGELCKEIGKGAGALLIEEEVVPCFSGGCLRAVLDSQPAWSELPIIVLLRQGAETRAARDALLLPGDVTLVERPVRVSTLVAAIGSALRSRQRQYLLRDQLRALQEAGENLKRANRELKQFAYVASHDLQEPLRMVSSYMQLLQNKYRGKLDEKAEMYIHFAVDGTKRMQNLIEGLLKYSRISRPTRTWVDTNQSFADAAANLAAAIQESDANVGSDHLPTVWGDATQLLQLFQNLLSNAIKYRKPGVAPRIGVSAKPTAEAWLFSVRDNGIGIGKEDHGKVFEIFRRLHTQEEYPGTGIGLASCKKIVEQHGGRIWLESSPGEGTTFFFTIPRKE